jgi:hypothetical protein
MRIDVECRGPEEFVATAELYPEIYGEGLTEEEAVVYLLEQCDGCDAFALMHDSDKEINEMAAERIERLDRAVKAAPYLRPSWGDRGA